MLMLRIRGGILLPVALLLNAGACGGGWEHSLVGTPRAPGADGVVQVEEIEGGNRLVTVVVSNLVPPRRLGAGLDTYVVWLAGRSGHPDKAGILEYDEESRQGNMFATTPHRRMELRITAERNGSVSSPGDAIVIRRRIETE
jgi:hypothetical protein